MHIWPVTIRIYIIANKVPNILHKYLNINQMKNETPSLSVTDGLFIPVSDSCQHVNKWYTTQ